MEDFASVFICGFRFGVGLYGIVFVVDGLVGQGEDLDFSYFDRGFFDVVVEVQYLVIFSGVLYYLGVGYSFRKYYGVGISFIFRCICWGI